MPLRPCLDCGRPVDGTRCPPHRRAKAREKRVRRPHVAAEDRRRAQAVADWRASHGDWCPGWRCDPHPSVDLTADHPHAVGAGGDERQPLTVLCRPCNGRKADRE